MQQDKLTDNWWSELIWEYNLSALTDEIIKKKQDRTDGKKLSDDSYDFIIFFNQVI